MDTYRGYSLLQFEPCVMPNGELGMRRMPLDEVIRRIDEAEERAHREQASARMIEAKIRAGGFGGEIYQQSDGTWVWIGMRFPEPWWKFWKWA